VLILYHDKELDSKTKGKGCIGDVHSDSIVGIRYLSDFPFNLLHKEVVITLDSLIENFKKREAFPHIYLDIHSFNYCANDGGGYRDMDQFVRALERTIIRSGAPQEMIHPTSSYTVLLDSLSSRLPEIPLYYEEHTDFHSGINVVTTHGYSGLVIKKQIIPAINAREEARNKGIKIIYFGGKSPVTIRKMLQTYPDAIQVNNVAAMRDIVDNG